jgi:Flp pilus assembly protein CpaB
LSTRIRSVLIILVGLILLVVGASVAMILIRRISPTSPAQQQAQVVKSPVVVLAHDMKLGDRISSADVTLQQVPVELLPRDAVSTVEAAIGRYIKSDLVQGEMLLQHDLADPTNNNHDLSFILSEDHVLMAFPADDLMSTENVIQRGDVVDILATYQVSAEDLSANNPPTTNTTATEATPTPEAQKPPVNFTIDAFQKVSVTALVLEVVKTSNTASSAIGGTSSSSKNETAPAETKISSYLLALAPQDALVLKHLKDLGAQFDIVLRNPTSTAQFELSPVEEQYIIDLYGLRTLP